MAYMDNEVTVRIAQMVLHLLQAAADKEGLFSRITSKQLPLPTNIAMG
jgi:hypothetical protein